MHVHNRCSQRTLLPPIMGLAAVLVILVVLGAIAALVAPTFARVLGWLLIPLVLIAAIAVVSKFTAGGTGELSGQIGLVIGGAIAALILLVGGALAFGLLGGSSAVENVAIAHIDNADANGLVTAAAAATALTLVSEDQPSAGLLRSPATGSEQEIPLLKRGFLEGRQPNRDDLAVLAHAALTDTSIAKLTDRISGETLLHWAARLNSPEAAARLLDCGANPDAANGRGLRPFSGCDTAFLERLQKAQAANR